MNNQFNFGKILRGLRSDKGMTQTQLANLLQMSQDTISLWENEKSIPDVLTLVKIAKLFDVSTDYLVGLEY